MNPGEQFLRYIRQERTEFCLPFLPCRSNFWPRCLMPGAEGHPGMEMSCFVPLDPHVETSLDCLLEL
jgi:hypothetical protein